MTDREIIEALRKCASEESRCVICEYRHLERRSCIAQLQRDAADALEQLQQAVETLSDVAEERRQEAARASEFQCALSPHPDGDPHILACVRCGSGEYLVNWDGNRNAYCGQCGQKIDWSREDDGDAQEPEI